MNYSNGRCHPRGPVYSNNSEANTNILSAFACRRTRRRRCGLVNFNKQPGQTIGRIIDTTYTGSSMTRHGRPQPSADSHRVINARDIQQASQSSSTRHTLLASINFSYQLSTICRFMLWPSMKNLKPTPRVDFRLGGYTDMIRQTQLV